ncbi:restriction endonuclease [Pseudomonas sp. D1-36]|uniref:restriction endonuclease n=1 Tax=Pseudomonas sp. D1-36 TaxID=2817387 RepID=UPI003DA7E3D3
MSKTIQRSMLGLIENLEQQRTETSNSLNWKDFEDHVLYVYQTLLRLGGHNILVAKDACLMGREGAEYQIDVYYEFELAGIRHRVAIECKNTKRRLERNDVLAFKAKIDEFSDVIGVIVSASGFQSGAKDFAERNRISALSIEEIPSIGQLLGMRLRHNAIPTELSVGTPFWTFFDLETGAPFGLGHDNGVHALLFWSKNQAAKYHARNQVAPNWQIRGLEGRHLFSYILVVDAMNGIFATAPPPNHEFADESNMFSDMPRQILIDEYCEQYKEQLRVRRVMPGATKGG